jgi:NADH-quinone oxidoreductase subunit C
VINNDEIKAFLTENFGSQFNEIEDSFGVFTIEVPVNQLFKLVNVLYRDLQYKFNNLVDLCGIHYPEQKGRELGVVYHIQSMINQSMIRVKVFVPIEKPEIPTLTGIYASANWMERETYDFFGINFLGHPNLKRILNMDEMVDFPLRKEFPLEDPYRMDKQDFQFGR